MKKSVRISISAVIAALIVFTSCIPVRKKGGKHISSAADGPVILTWWEFPNFDGDGSFERNLIAAFELKNPDIKVKLEMISFQDGPAKITTAIASNTAPDFTYDAPGRIIAWGNDGLLAPLDDIIAPEKAHLASAPLAASKGADGAYYMYPVHTGGFTMAFNKEMLEDLGLIDMLPYKTADRTWTLKQYEDLLRAIKAKLPPGKVPAVFYAKSQSGDQGTRAFMVNLHGNAPLMNEDRTRYVFNGQNAVKNVQWLQKAVKEGLLMNGAALQAGDAIDMYCASNAAGTILYSLQLEKINDAKINYNGKKFTSIFMPFPNDAGNPVLEFIVGGPCIFDNGDPAKIAAGKKLASFIAGDPEWAPKLIAATGLFPVSDKITIELDSDEQKWNARAARFFGDYYNTVAGFSEMRTYWFPAMQAVLNGRDAQKTLDIFVQRSNAVEK
ncbi:ABC transporter substrate-binding protein [Treponema sp. HNW]|uniref:ABC transporter substrate-binding protein n=1 Tax=Treponema sp. HNW TaxID=3116654 RepID=UPI003D14248E